MHCLLAEAQPRQICLNRLVQPARFGLLLAPLGDGAGHFLLEGFAIVFLGRDADVAAGGEDVGVFADFFEGDAFAEAGDVGVGPVFRRRGFCVTRAWVRGRPLVYSQACMFRGSWTVQDRRRAGTDRRPLGRERPSVSEVVPALPLTDCRRVRRRLPLPQARVKSGPASRDRGGSGVGARKTPHRFPAGTPESASPPGEGEERRLLEGNGTAHPPATTALAAPLGESFG